MDLDTAADTLTVRYEDLTGDTETQLKRVCTFLHLPYTAEMSRLKQPAESMRKGRQLKTVVKQQAKYREQLPPATIRRISEITLPYLAKYGYSDEAVSDERPLSRVHLRLLAYTDGLASLHFHIREKVLRKSTFYYLKRRFETATGVRRKFVPSSSRTPESSSGGS